LRFEVSSGFQIGGKIRAVFAARVLGVRSERRTRSARVLPHATALVPMEAQTVMGQGTESKSAPRRSLGSSADREGFQDSSLSLVPLSFLPGGHHGRAERQNLERDSEVQCGHSPPAADGGPAGTGITRDKGLH